MLAGDRVCITASHEATWQFATHSAYMAARSTGVHISFVPGSSGLNYSHVHLACTLVQGSQMATRLMAHVVSHITSRLQAFNYRVCGAHCVHMVQ